MDEEEDPIWRRIDDELQRRGSKGETPATWPDLGRAMGLTSDQRAMPVNWRLRRKLPPAWHQKAAEALGWKVDFLLRPEAEPTAGSPDAPQPAQIPVQITSLTREQFLAHCANLSTPDWQLTARLWVAVGILPGAVEVKQEWRDLKEAGSGKAEKMPMTVEATPGEQAKRGRL